MVTLYWPRDAFLTDLLLRVARLAELVDLRLELCLGLPGAPLLLRQLLLQLRDDVLLRLVRREQLRRLRKGGAT